MSTGTHLRLWFKYGFCHRDPPELTRIIGNQPPVAPGWGQYPPQQQTPYYGPPLGGHGPTMQQQHMSQYYQQPQPWQQSQTPPSGWTGYPPTGQQYSQPGQPHPYPGYTNLAPPQQSGLDKSVTVITESSSPEVVPSAPSAPVPSVSPGPPVSPAAPVAPRTAVSPPSEHNPQPHELPKGAQH